MKYECKIIPNKYVDIGNGIGIEFVGKLFGGEVGFILDGRGRDIEFSKDDKERIAQIVGWSKKTNEYIK